MARRRDPVHPTDVPGDGRVLLPGWNLPGALIRRLRHARGEMDGTRHRLRSESMRAIARRRNQLGQTQAAVSLDRRMGGRTQPNCTDHLANAPVIRDPVIGTAAEDPSSPMAPADTSTGASCSPIGRALPAPPARRAGRDRTQPAAPAGTSEPIQARGVLSSLLLRRGSAQFEGLYPSLIRPHVVRSVGFEISSLVDGTARYSSGTCTKLVSQGAANWSLSQRSGPW